jgi:hypothetical protein
MKKLFLILSIIIIGIAALSIAFSTTGYFSLQNLQNIQPITTIKSINNNFEKITPSFLKPTLLVKNIKKITPIKNEEPEETKNIEIEEEYEIKQEERLSEIEEIETIKINNNSLGLIVEYDLIPRWESRDGTNLIINSLKNDNASNSITDQIIDILEKENMEYRINEYKNILRGIGIDYISLIPYEVENRIKEKIGNLDLIKATYPNQEVQAFLQDTPDLVQATDLWENEEFPNTGQGVRIAILDTGVDYTHPDLGNGCYGEGCKVIGGYDFVNNDNDPMDDQMHGTHVASTAAGNGILKGIAPDADIIAFKVLNDKGRGSTAGILNGMDRLLDPNNDGDSYDKAHVANMSLGSLGGTPNHVLSQKADELMEAGVIMVISAGNSGPGEYMIGSPGTSEKAITVGAVDKNLEMADFSSRGGVTWGWIAAAMENEFDRNVFAKPDLVAPGVSICAAKYNEIIYQGYDCTVENEHFLLSGTSMSAPVVSGAAAIIFNQNRWMNPLQIKSQLQATAIKINKTVNSQGAGFLDTRKATEDIGIAMNPGSILHLIYRETYKEGNFKIENLSKENKLIKIFNTLKLRNTQEEEIETNLGFENNFITICINGRDNKDITQKRTIDYNIPTPRNIVTLGNFTGEIDMEVSNIDITCEEYNEGIETTETNQYIQNLLITIERMRKLNITYENINFNDEDIKETKINTEYLPFEGPYRFLEGGISNSRLSSFNYYVLEDSGVLYVTAEDLNNGEYNYYNNYTTFNFKNSTAEYQDFLTVNFDNRNMLAFDNEIFEQMKEEEFSGEMWGSFDSFIELEPKIEKSFEIKFSIREQGKVPNIYLKEDLFEPIWLSNHFTIISMYNKIDLNINLKEDKKENYISFGPELQNNSRNIRIQDLHQYAQNTFFRLDHQLLDYQFIYETPPITNISIIAQRGEANKFTSEYYRISDLNGTEDYSNLRLNFDRINDVDNEVLLSLAKGGIPIETKIAKFGQNLKYLFINEQGNPYFTNDIRIVNIVKRNNQIGDLEQGDYVVISRLEESYLNQFEDYREDHSIILKENPYFIDRNNFNIENNNLETETNSFNASKLITFDFQELLFDLKEHFIGTFEIINSIKQINVTKLKNQILSIELRQTKEYPQEYRRIYEIIKNYNEDNNLLNLNEYCLDIGFNTNHLSGEIENCLKSKYDYQENYVLEGDKISNRNTLLEGKGIYENKNLILSVDEINSENYTTSLSVFLQENMETPITIKTIENFENINEYLIDDNLNQIFKGETQLQIKIEENTNFILLQFINNDTEEKNEGIYGKIDGDTKLELISPNEEIIEIPYQYESSNISFRKEYNSYSTLQEELGFENGEIYIFRLTINNPYQKLCEETKYLYTSNWDGVRLVSERVICEE